MTHLRYASRLLVLVLAASSHAHAQDATAEPDDAYRAIVSRAITEFDAASYDEALALFEQAYALRPSARVLRGMGKVYFEQRQYVRAEDAFEASLVATVDPLSPAMRAEVEDLRARASTYIGRLAIDVEPASATLLVDGQHVVVREDLRLDVGSHVIEASARGHRPARRVVEIGGGARTQLTIALEAEAPPIVVERSRGPMTATMVTGIGLAGATVASSIWLASRSDALGACRAAEREGVSCVTRGALRRERNAALGSTAISASLFAGFAVAFVVLVTHHDDSAPPVRLACDPRVGGVACTASGQF